MRGFIPRGASVESVKNDNGHKRLGQFSNLPKTGMTVLAA